MLDGLEWNVRVSHAENSSVIDKFAAAFDGYWNDPGFERYDPKRDAQRLDEALNRSSDSKVFVLPRLDLQPFPFQQEILDRLDAERHVHDRWRNLVVAATGTGKTVIAALDYRRLRAELGGNPTLLFVAHRKEILDQSLGTFRIALDGCRVRRAPSRGSATRGVASRVRLDPVVAQLRRREDRARPLRRCDHRRVPPRPSGDLSEPARAPTPQGAARSDRDPGARRWPRHHSLVRRTLGSRAADLGSARPRAPVPVPLLRSG